MKRLSFLTILSTLAFSPVLLAQDPSPQTCAIEQAHLTFPLPLGWIRMPDKALDRFRQNAGQTAPNLKSNYVAGFAGPRPPANTPFTLLLVQVFPRDLTPQVFATSIKAAQQALAKQRPDLKLEQPAPYVDLQIGAVVSPGRTQQGTSGRAYTVPTSQGVIALDLYCPTEGADRTFSAVEASLKRMVFTDGVALNRKWLEDFSLASK